MSDELFSKKGLKKAIKESQEILNLVPKMYIKPGEAFSKILEIAKFKKLYNFLIIYYTCFSPFFVLLMGSLIFSQVEASLLTVMFSMPFLLIAAVVSCMAIALYALLVSFVFSGIYYFLGKLFKAEGEFNDILSVMILYVASTSLIVLPIVSCEELPESVIENLNLSGLNMASFIIVILVSLIYLPAALSKSLKINLPRAFGLTLLPYFIFLIVASLVAILI